ncbi:MAG: leucine-rich repeat domain-containing protein [Methyloglobulus sp.]|nr:leucine-rich repeat domain-containing protein [Methyloglobulus sp.]
MVLLDRPFEEGQLCTEAELDLRNIGPKVWPLVLSSCRTTDLRLYHITLGSIEGIEQLVCLKRLAMEWATKISDITSVFQLRSLTTLSIFDFSKLKLLDGIESLDSLVELNLSGSRGALTPRLKLASIEPIVKLRKLSSFSLTNAQLDDDDITVLARCENLKHLQLANNFDRGQFAYLAKHLNAQLVEPLSAFYKTTLKCERCDGSKSMFIGRRMPFLCQACDSSRFDRHVSEFERLVRDA